jgi:inosine-uridine nucleoside N-ribohydrolase
MTSIRLDTDIGGDVDDAVALLLAIRHPEIGLVGISTVLHRVDVGAWIAEEMLRRAGADEIAVLPGAVSPLGVDYDSSGDWIPTHGRLAPRMPRPSAKHDGERVESIAQAMIAQPQPFHLVTIGPLTNVAALLASHPEISSRWTGVTCMGGRLEGDAEYNLQADVEATRVTLRHLHPRLVGLEACSHTLTREEAEAALEAEEPASAFLLDCYREYRAHAEWLQEPDGAPLTLFDPITLLALVHEELLGFQDLHVLVEKDGRLRLTDDGERISYANQCNWDEMKRVILRLLSGSTSAQ